MVISAYAMRERPFWRSRLRFDTLGRGGAHGSSGQQDLCRECIYSNYAPSFTTEYGNSTLIGHYALAEGSFMFKEGVASQVTYGEILSSNYSVTSRGVTLTDLYATSAKSLMGDSGGVAYDAGNRVIGSVVGAGYTEPTPSLDNFAIGYICKYSNAAEALNCSIS